MPSILVLTGVLLSYLLGAMPFGYLIARSRGVDIFTVGSGNIGATNVGRILGWKLGLLVLVLDFLKGALPTLVMAHGFGVPEGVFAGLAAFLGHMFPVYLRFRGGKGVATGFGVVAVLLPGATLVAVLVWLTVLAATRYVAIASMLAALALAAFRLLTAAEPFAADERILTGFSLLAAALVVVRHHSNLTRLIYGQEHRVPDSSRLLMLARVLHVLALGLWFGSGVFFTFIAAPSLFRTFESQVAGTAVGPIFPQYFALQGICGLVALVTAWSWTRTATERIHRIRFVVLAVALALVLIGWPLAGKVSERRVARNAADQAVAASARAAFDTWHTASVILSIATIALAGVGLALAARLPEPTGVRS